MSEQKVLVYEPKDISMYVKSRDGPEEFLEQVLRRYAHEFTEQFRLFLYVYFQRGVNNRSYAGFMYRREKFDDKDPLSYVTGADLKEVIPKLASELGAEVVHVDFFKGRFEIAEPTKEQAGKIVDLSLGTEHKDYGLDEPAVVKRFVLNLNRRAFEYVIIPHLERRGFSSNIDFYKV